MISPAHRIQDAASLARYRIEPYVVAGDICTFEPLRGRGGWSWYSGAASWSWRLAVEGILGIRLVEGRLQCRPNLPSDWDGYSAVLKRPHGTIEIRVECSASAQTPSCEIDGSPTQDTTIPFPGQGKTRKVRFVLPRAGVTRAGTARMAGAQEAG